MSKGKTSNKPILFVVSAPSGAGKTTVVERLLKNNRRLRKTVSHTTRPSRPGERYGRDYYFTSRKAFQTKVRHRDFVEWARVYGEFYGTSKQTIQKHLRSGHDVMLVIEEQGARAIRRQFPDAVFILLLPPSLPELRRRILRRRGMTKTEIQKRLRAARREIRAMKWYTYAVTNDRVSKAVKVLEAIVGAEHAKASRSVY